MPTLILILDVLVSLLLVVVAIPFLKDEVPPNRLYGVRIPKSLSSPDNWYRINRYAAKRLIQWTGAGLLVVLVGFFLRIEEGSALFWAYLLVPALAALLACLQTLWHARNL